MTQLLGCLGAIFLALFALVLLPVLRLGHFLFGMNSKRADSQERIHVKISILISKSRTRKNRKYINEMRENTLILKM